VEALPVFPQCTKDIAELQDAEHAVQNGMLLMGCSEWDAAYGMLRMGCSEWDAAYGMLRMGCCLCQ